MERTTVYLDSELKRRLKEAAARTHKSEALMIREALARYLATEEPWDKAGGYAIQGLAGAFVSAIEGSYSNVVGLPLTETWQLLQSQGIATGLEGRT